MNHRASEPVRVLVVDDSAFMRTALSRMIAAEPCFGVVATACDGYDALEKIAALDPDIVTLDIQMPRLDGLATLRRIMNEFPRPVIMVSAATVKDAEITFDALSAGAFDYIPKSLSSASLDIEHIRADLIAKLHAAALVRKPRPGNHDPKKPVQSCNRETATPSIVPVVVVIGASTGGPKALAEILPCFPREFPLPILIAQHMPIGFSMPFAQRLNGLCSISVREPSDGQTILPGVAYIAPSGKHMRAERPLSAGSGIISLSNEPQSAMHRPSINILMKSVAETYGNGTIGVILTGMGSDGAAGMKSIYRAGGLTIGQDQATCTVFGMPRACAELGVINRMASLSQIPSLILETIAYRKHA